MPDPAEGLLARYRTTEPDSAQGLLQKYAGQTGDPAESLLQKYGATPAEPWWGRALRFVGEPIIGAMTEFGERTGRAVGGAIAAPFGQAPPGPPIPGPYGGLVPEPIAAPVTGLVRGALLKQGPHPSEVYREAGYKGLPPEWQAALNVGRYPQLGTVAGAALSPEGLGLATELVGASALDPLAGVTIAPAARAVGRALGPLRGVTGISELGNFFSRGFSIVNPADRETVREIFRSSRGVGARVEDFVESRLDRAEDLIRAAAKRRGQDASTTERFVRDLVEVGHRDPMVALRALPEEGQAAAILRELGDALPEFRIRQGLRPAELMREAPGLPPDPGAFAADAVPLLRRAAKQRGSNPEAVLDRLRRVAAAGPQGRASGAVGETLLPEERAILDMLDEYRQAGLNHQDALEAARRAVRYTPRLAEESLAKVLGTAGGRRIGISELAPRLPGMRATPPEMTTSELEAAIESGVIRGTPVKAPLKPMLEAFGIRGRGTARAAANARAINHIALQFGVDETAAKAGWRSLGELGILGEYQPAVKAALSRTYVHPDIFKYMDEFTKATTPRNLPVMNRFLKVWKPLVTTINPGFISRNFQWNGIVGWIFGNRNPKNWLDAAEVMSLGEPRAIVAGLGKTRQAMHNEMLANRVIGAGYSRELAPGLAEHRIVRPGVARVRAAIERPSRVGRDINAAGEDLSRAAFYIAMRRQGMSEAQAARKVAQVYFDYTRDAFTAPENWLRANLIPFYSWTRRIIPLTFRALGERPAAFAQMGAIEATSARIAGLKPEEVRNLSPEFRAQGGIVIPPYPGGKGEGYTAIPMTAIGFFDPARMGQALGEGGRPFVEQWINSMSPPVKALYEGIMARSTFTGREQKGRPTRLPSWVGAIPAANKDLGDALGIFKGPDGYYGPDYLYTLFSTPGPFATMAGDLVLANQGNRKAGDRALRWITGIRVAGGLQPERTKRFEITTEKRAERERLRQQALNRARRLRLMREAQ